ncbi:MAG: hypothetical protein U9Q07_09265 [Planctomycetota bacterium]|nr:hypothetical protein [Planctomycetota bacterium]
MSKIPVFLVLAFSASAAFGALGFDAAITLEPPLLRDGFVLRGVDGELSGPDSNDAWFFEIASDVNDYRAVAKAGTKLELLPSSALEKMIADSKMRSEVTYRLWNGRVTRYKGKNFIFPTYFLAVSPIRKSRPEVSEEPQQKKETEPIVRDPNDVLTIPPDILEKLRARREEMATIAPPIVDSNRVDEPNLASEDEKQPEPEHYSQGADSVFVDRTAFLVGQGDGGLVFALEALGRNARQLSLRLLPCEVLELAEFKRSTELEPVRFKIAGILTKYEDHDYLLLQKATQIYSHGNFGR